MQDTQAFLQQVVGIQRVLELVFFIFAARHIKGDLDAGIVSSKVYARILELQVPFKNRIEYIPVDNGTL